jgi:hypothetical protein
MTDWKNFYEENQILVNFIIAIIVVVAFFWGIKTLISTNTSSSSNQPVQRLSPLVEGTFDSIKVSVLDFNTSDTYDDQATQGKFKILTIRLINNRNDAISVSSYNFKLSDDKNREFEATSNINIQADLVVSEKGLIVSNLNPGMSTEGIVVFEVPEDAKGFVLKGTLLLFGTEMNLKLE